MAVNTYFQFGNLADMGQLDTVARERIAAWRRTSGMTQAALGEAIGRNAVWVSRYLDNAYDADLDTLARMAAVFEKTLMDLLGAAGSGVEGEVVERLRAMPSEQREKVLDLMRILTPAVVWPSSQSAPSKSDANARSEKQTTTTRGVRRAKG